MLPCWDESTVCGMLIFMVIKPKMVKLTFFSYFRSYSFYKHLNIFREDIKSSQSGLSYEN